MSHIPQKVHDQRMKLQLQTLESPTDFTRTKPGRLRDTPRELFQPKPLRLESADTEIVSRSPVNLTRHGKSDRSPVTDLAFNLCDTNLSSPNTPQMKIKKINYESDSPSPPLVKKNLWTTDSPPSPRSCPPDSGTPLTSITNKTKGKFGGRSLTRCATEPSDLEANKENIPLTKLRRRYPNEDVDSSPSKLGLKERLGHSPMIQSPGKDQPNAFHSIKPFSQKRPIFAVLEDENSMDSGFSSQSQPFEELRQRKKSRCEENAATPMDDILTQVSPSKEGCVALQMSPCSKQASETSSKDDGFDVFFFANTQSSESMDSLPEIPEEEEDPPSSPTKAKNGFQKPSTKSLLTLQDNNKSFLNRRSSSNSAPSGQRSLKRSQSMIDRAFVENSPLARNEYNNRFKRPDAPEDQRFSMVEGKCSSLGHEDRQLPRKPFLRSQSEVAIKKSFEFKDDNDDILPDSYGKYCLPSRTGMSKNHPNLRSIECHTLAELMAGKYKESVNSFRVIDVRYKFEYDGGHINGAENWEHGEDEKFLSGLLPTEPLDRPPSPGDEKNERRNIVIFHCEFSSQRAPDFYKKLREQDRNLNLSSYPALHFPEVYLLHKGYKEFYSHYPQLCTGPDGYTEMVDPRYQTELRTMRAKSKSWSGGTVSRTGKMSRRFH